MNADAHGVDGWKTWAPSRIGDHFMEQHEITIRGEHAKRAHTQSQLDGLGYENDEKHRFRPLTGLKGTNGAFSIEQDSSVVTVRIANAGVADQPLLISISPRSVLVFSAPNEREAEDDHDHGPDELLRLISIPVEINPEQVQASLQGEELVLVLPISVRARRST